MLSIHMLSVISVGVHMLQHPHHSSRLVVYRVLRLRRESHGEMRITCEPFSMYTLSMSFVFVFFCILNGNAMVQQM